jgi:serine/threonine protein kinase
VYRAKQDDYDREVAIKVLNIDVSDRRAQRRFQRERALNGRLSSHPNVVTILDSGFVDGRYPYLSMELFERGTLYDRMLADGPFDLDEALHIGIRIAGALETAHRLGVLHRDVKPQNILLSRFGEPALADFGIAAILEMDHSMTSALTPVHAAPELLEGGEPSARSDVYALGSTLYSMLAGSAPFAGPPGEGVLAQLLRITTSELPALPRSDVPPSLVDLLRASTAKRPDERTPSAAAFGSGLQQLQTELGLPVTSLPVEAPSTLDAAAARTTSERTSAEATAALAPTPIPAPPTVEPSIPDPAPFVEPFAPVARFVEPEAVEPSVADPPPFVEPPAPVAPSVETAAVVASYVDERVEGRVVESPPAAFGAPALADASPWLEPPDALALRPIDESPPTGSSDNPAPESVVDDPITQTAASVDLAVDDGTVGFQPESTIIGRQHHPDQPTAPRPPRRWVRPVAGVALLAVVAGAAYGVTTAVTGDDDAPAPTTTALDVAGSVPEDTSVFAPTDVAVSLNTGVVIVSWTDQTDGQRPHIIFVFGTDGSDPTPILAPAGTTSKNLDGVDATAPACFVVSAAITLGNETTPTVRADAEAYCINGAVSSD